MKYGVAIVLASVLILWGTRKDQLDDLTGPGI